MTPPSPSLQPLLGLTGKKRSGKDTFAAVLVEEYGFTRVAFADPVKEAVLALNPIVHVEVTSVLPSPLISEEELAYEQLLEHVPDVMRLGEAVDEYGWDRAKESLPEVRRLLQEYGTGIRVYDPEFWTREAVRRIEAVDGPVVVTDVRFRNEAQLITDLGGTGVKIVRPGQSDDDNHPSEREVDLTDWPHVVNDAGVAELQQLARLFAESVL